MQPDKNDKSDGFSDFPIDFPLDVSHIFPVVKGFSSHVLITCSPFSRLRSR